MDIKLITKLSVLSFYRSNLKKEEGWNEKWSKVSGTVETTQQEWWWDPFWKAGTSETGGGEERERNPNTAGGGEGRS